MKVHLPRAAARPDVRRDDSGDSMPHGKGETILVLEDDREVRRLAVKMLERLGYRVRAVMDADSARDLLGQVDLVLSDVVLPGRTSGPELAAEARAEIPGLKFIFMSGYPADAANRHDSLEPGFVLLNKPFDVGTLAKVLRAALD